MDDDHIYNIIGLVASIVGLLSAVSLSRIFYRLPRNKIQYLECLLCDTDRLFNAAVKDGLIRDRDVVKNLYQHLWEYVFR